MRRIFLLLCCFPLVVSAAITFPPLTGRVVDNAAMLSPAEEQQLAGLLDAHEQRTTNQVVVVTLPNLDGYTIEDYGYQLGRHWGIGQKGKDNGVLLIVAQQERKVRIEVGYGLEGVLTDALSSIIIQNEILPAFRQGQFDQGIVQGASAIVRVLDGEYVAPEKGAGKDEGSGWSMLVFFIFLVIWLYITLFSRHRGIRGGRGGYGGGGFGGGGFGRGGFGGGGGGFGGGGASGGW